MSTSCPELDDRIAVAIPDTIEAVLAMFPPEAPKRTPRSSPPEPTTDEEVRKVRRALLNVPADDYDVWVSVGMALKATFAESQAIDLWDEWSRRSAKYEATEAEKHWRSFHDRPGGKSIAYVYWLAKQHEPGWRQAWQREEGPQPTGPSAGAPPTQPAAPASPPTRRADSPSDILDRWAKHGPLIHLPTGIRGLDLMIGGGPVFGTRFYFLGAPDAGKTALIVQILDEYLERGLAVGLLAVDEDPEDLLQRFLQRRNWTRQQCEQRKPEDLAQMREQVAGLPLRLYDASYSIEAAAEDLARFAKERGLRAAFGIDSIQTARCALEDESASRYEAVTARVQAVRRVATEHDFITFATSEMSRAAYRSVAAGERINDMAAAKESGAIEYSARVAVSLRSVENQPDLVNLRVIKNKHGQSHAPSEPGIHLRLDRKHQRLTEDTEFACPQPENSAKAKAALKDQETLEDAARIAVIVARTPGIVSTDLEAAASARTPGGMGVKRFGRARATLGQALVTEPGKRTTKHVYLNPAVLDPEVLARVPAKDRPIVASSRPPEAAPPSRSQPLRAARERLKHHARGRRSPPPVRGGSGSAGACQDADLSSPGAPAETGSASTLNHGGRGNVVDGGQKGAGNQQMNIGDSALGVVTEDDGRPEQPRKRRRRRSGAVGGTRRTSGGGA